MSPLAIVGIVAAVVIVIGVLWFVFSSKKEQAHIETEVTAKVSDLANAANPTTQPIRADVAADIAKVEAAKVAPATPPVA
jgi:FtsZ-interacting cell division protein ZipA